ncbi:MAG TPA: class I SAM-dependent methyltransferase [Acidimicrobiia bacterium]|nr:class I SAM-dependent methyltransferase [Acidimicrobiia bacterium]
MIRRTSNGLPNRETDAQCVVCGGTTTTLFEAMDVNRRVTDERFIYEVCRVCDVIVLANPPADIWRFYRGEYFAEPTRRQLEHASRRESYQLGFVSRHVDGGRLVEIGAAWGTFALNATKSGFEVTALEADERCCSYLERELNIQTIRTRAPHTVLASLPPSAAIALWQTLEHLPDPHATLAAAAENLDAGGVLVIATPNPESLGFRMLRQKWPHVDAPRHLWLLPIDHLAERAASLGLELIELTTSDTGARRWNTFAWQRYFANGAEHAALRVGALALGWMVALASAPFERRGRNGSSYTAVFRKTPV